ncbi:solute carrier family 47 (multidrug and toxin extrusion), member 1 isoform X1 [Silurus asotus]|uniref:Multidrug and toxin extrusion protein n=1 Tax=Silurus asotus TaxID=30991 RepID=A0AAD5FLK2_SILAS|nr:solute carrier family 47 (multidrug and toxin extrusion), member 1 isoform X1 [Silurus asotus]
MDKAGISEAASPLAGTAQVTEATAASSRVFGCSFVRHWVPLAYREELYQVLRLTGPLLVTRILGFLQPFVSTIFVGHLGNAELAGYALASATINVTTAATGCGLALTCDTLVSQTFGSKNLKRVGEIMQRSILILLLFCLPCWAILINSESLLLLLQQEAEVARIAQLYVIAFLPAVPAFFLHQLQVAYLQNQGIILPQMYTAVIANVLNVGINYMLIFRMGLGVKGSAAANCISQFSISLLLFCYIRWKKLHVSTWGGWSMASLQEWDSFMKLAIPSTLMLCFEWWVYEIGGFLAGMLGEVDLAAQHVLLELGSITYMFPLGVHAAACVRVGNALGAGDTQRALITSKVALLISGVLAVLQGIVLGSTKSVIGLIFTNDESIVEIVSTNMTFYVFLQFVDALVCVSSGILLGSGKQKIAAISNLIFYYCIGLPLGISLMFAAKLRILGLTLGLLVCVIIQACFFITLIFKLDWQKLTEKAQKRAGKNVIVNCVGQKAPLSVPVRDSMIPEGPDNPELLLAGGSMANSVSPCSPMSTKEQVKTRSAKEEPDVGEAGEVQPKALLSVPQLVLRRGSAVLAAVLMLAVSIVAYLTCPPPQPFINLKSNHTTDWGNHTSPTAFPNTTAPDYQTVRPI